MIGGGTNKGSKGRIVVYRGCFGLPILPNLDPEVCHGYVSGLCVGSESVCTVRERVYLVYKGLAREHKTVVVSRGTDG